MGLTADQLLSACTLAAYSGDIGFFAKPGYGACAADAKNAGHTLNVMQYAYLARAGVEAATLAKMDFKGGTLVDNNAIASRYATCGLGKEYNVMDMYFKPWPTCRKTHGAIAATLELREKYGVKPEDVASIKIFQQTTGMYVNTPINTTMDQFGGYFSLQYTVSCAMLDGNVELYASDTLEAMDTAFIKQIRDTVAAAVDQIRFDKVIDIMKQARDAKLNTQDIPNLVQLTGQKFGITESERGGVLQHLIEGNDLSLYGLSNAVTRYAQDVESYDRSTELEGVGYKILTMSPHIWRYINQAAA
jgi:hypothetical protein